MYSKIRHLIEVGFVLSDEIIELPYIYHNRLEKFNDCKTHIIMYIIFAVKSLNEN